jgi:transposase
MVYVGVDIAKMDHVVGAVDERGERVCGPMGFKNTEAGFARLEAWLDGIAEGPGDVVVGMEATGHYWMACHSSLTSKGYAVAVVNPVQVRAVRDLKGRSRVKNDRVDSELIAETMRIGQCDPTRLATDAVQALRLHTRYRQSLRDAIAEAKTQAKCLLDSYFPEYGGTFSDEFGAASMAVLKRCPTAEECRRTQARTLSRLMSEASRRRLGDERAAELKAKAKSSVGIGLAWEAASLEIRGHVAHIEYLEGEVAKLDRVIADALDRVEPLVLTIPGIGTTNGAQIVAEIGDVSRFRNAAALVSYAGLNPSVSQSGKFEATDARITKKGSAYLRRAMWLAASRACQCDTALGDFYARKRSEGKSHREAVTAVARKLCHIVFAVMRDQRPYDPTKPGRDPSGAAARKQALFDSQGASNADRA